MCFMLNVEIYEQPLKTSFWEKKKYRHVNMPFQHPKICGND